MFYLDIENFDLRIKHSIDRHSYHLVRNHFKNALKICDRPLEEALSQTTYKEVNEDTLSYVIIFVINF